jgi:hypothetical protein
MSSTSRETHRPQGRAQQRARAVPGGRSARIGSWTWADPVVRAWVFVALIPVFALLGYAAAAGGYLLLRYRPEADDAPLWLDRLAVVTGFVMLAVPCAQAIRYGNRARAGADRRGVPPLAVGLLVGGWWLAVEALALAGTF